MSDTINIVSFAKSKSQQSNSAGSFKMSTGGKFKFSPLTIWGNPFDGESDVEGNLKITNHDLYVSGNVTMLSSKWNQSYAKFIATNQPPMEAMEDQPASNGAYSIFETQNTNYSIKSTNSCNAAMNGYLLTPTYSINDPKLMAGIFFEENYYKELDDNNLTRIRKYDINTGNTKTNSLQVGSIVNYNNNKNDNILVGSPVSFKEKIYTTDIQNSGEIVTKNLTVTGKAHFFELVVDKIKAAGGQVILTAATAKVDLVEDTGDSYRLYFRANDENDAIDNEFEVGDQIICQSFNRNGLTAGESAYNVSNQYWWRLCTGVDSKTVRKVVNGNEEDCHYVDVSKTVCDDGSSTPEAGDEIVLLGSRNSDTKRQNAILLCAYNSYDLEIQAPCIAQYEGITTFELSKYRTQVMSPGKNEFRGSFTFESGKTMKEELEGMQPYVHIAWANSSDGQTDFIKDTAKTNSDKSYAYIGFCTNLTESDEDLGPADYRWTNTKGDKGDQGDPAVIDHVVKKYTTKGIDETFTIETMPDSAFTQTTIPQNLDTNTWLLIRTWTYYKNMTNPIVTNEKTRVGGQGADGEKGQGVFTSFMFKRSTDKPTTNLLTTEGSFSDPSPSNSKGWSDGIPDGGGSLWCQSRIFTSDGKSPQQTSWQAPRLMSDSADIDICFTDYPGDNPTAPKNHNTENQGQSGYISTTGKYYYWTDSSNANSIWMAISTKSGGVWSSWKMSRIKGERGEDGDPGLPGADGSGAEQYRLIPIVSKADIVVEKRDNKLYQNLKTDLQYKYAKVTSTGAEIFSPENERGKIGIYVHKIKANGTSAGLSWMTISSKGNGVFTHSQDDWVNQGDNAIAAYNIYLAVKPNNNPDAEPSKYLDRVQVRAEMEPKALMEITDHIFSLVQGHDETQNGTSTFEQTWQGFLTSVKSWAFNSDGSLKTWASRISQKANSIDMWITEDDLKNVGMKIDGTTKTITMQANKFNINNVAGNKVLSSDTQGNLEITGKINATGGKIGGLEIKDNALTNEGFTNDAYIVMRNDKIGGNTNSNTFVGIGSNVWPGSAANTKATARFENKYTDSWHSQYYNNIAIYAVANGARYNFALTGKGNIAVNGFSEGFALTVFTPSSSGNVINDISKGNRVLVKITDKNYTTVYIPTLPNVRSSLGIGTETQFATELTIIAFADNVANFTLRAQEGCTLYDNSGSSNTISMGKGDVTKLMLIYDGNNYAAYLIGHSR